MESFNEAYTILLNAPRQAPRGQPTREMLFASFDFAPKESFIYHPKFHDNREYVKKELKWYMNGKFNDLSIADEAKIWRDHITGGLLWSNYGGWLWGNQRTYQGLLNAVMMIRKDRNTRRAIAYIGANDLVSEMNNDVPCTNTIHFIIRDDKLFVRVGMRSQDAYFGLRNDLPAFQFFAQVFGFLTESKVHVLRIDVGSFHIYERHVARIEAALNGPEEIWTTEFDYGNMVEDFAKELGERLETK